jgi:tetratricopeptide (TPR) repeat protein
MHSARTGGKALLALAALLAANWLATAAPAPDSEQDLRKQALKLNNVTGQDTIKGQVEALVKDAAATKKLLKMAAGMTSDKEQPFNYNALYILAQTAYLLKDDADAHTFYRLAVKQANELHSGNKQRDAYTGLLAVLGSGKKYDEAEKVCEEIVKLPGDDDTLRRFKVTTYRRLAVIQASQGKVKEANEIVDKFLKADPDNWLSLELKGEVQRAAKQYAEAAKTYEDVLDHIEKDKELKKEEHDAFAGEVRYILSQLYMETNNVDKATAQLEKAVVLDPQNATYQNDLGYIWADHDKNLDRAEKLVRKALELDRKERKDGKVTPEEDHDNGAYLDSLGWVLYKKKQYKEALEALKEAVKDKDSQHVEIYSHLGDVYMALNQKDDAAKAYKDGIKVAGPTKREQEIKGEVEKKLKDAQK